MRCPFCDIILKIKGSLVKGAVERSETEGLK